MGVWRCAVEDVGMTIDPTFWKGKKVFLTGHTGFKGSWLSLWLQHMGAHVKGYALTPPTTPSLFQEAQVEKGMDSVIADIRDFDRLKAEITSFAPNIIIHMAAQPLVRFSYEDPIETYSTNVMGTVHLLEAIRTIDGVQVCLNVTSDKCYENQEWDWGYRENEPMGGRDPYSNSKGCAELVTAAFRESFFHPDRFDQHGCAIATGRAGNVIGGGDWADDRLVPDVLTAFEKQTPVVIRNPHAIRPWQHVLEPLAGYLTLVQKLWEDGPRYAGPWNFGPNEGDAKPVSWICDAMVKEWPGSSWSTDNGDHPHEAHYLKLDSTKAREYLGWRPVWSLGDALKRITAWHQAWLAGENMHDYTQAEISTYQTLANSP